MNQTQTGALIRALRLAEGMTQAALAQALGVSDKAVSKWENGRGAPDVSLLPQLSQLLGVDPVDLLRGKLPENPAARGNMKHLRFFRCPQCGNLLWSTDGANLSCCGKRLTPLRAREPDGEHALSVRSSDGEWYITGAHPMEREHSLVLLALVTGDSVVLRRLYPQWGLECRLPGLRGGQLYVLCSRDGLFVQPLPR